MTASSTGKRIAFSVAYLNSFYKSCEALKTQEGNATVLVHNIKKSQQRRHRRMYLGVHLDGNKHASTEVRLCSWADCPVVKSTWCSCRGSESGPQQPPWVIFNHVQRQPHSV